MGIKIDRNGWKTSFYWIVLAELGQRKVYRQSWGPPGKSKTKTENSCKISVCSDESSYDYPGRVLTLLGKSTA